MEKIMKEVAIKLAQLIEEKGITKKTVAEHCGKTPGWLNNILNYDKDIKIPDLLKIAKLLEVDVTEILPVPKKLNIEKMTFADLIRHIVREECEEYLIKEGLLSNPEVIVDSRIKDKIILKSKIEPDKPDKKGINNE